MFADAILTEMLQAQITIVDEAGHTEESMTIPRSGRLSIGRRQTGGYLHADESATDLAVLIQDGQDGARVSIDVKMENAVQRDGVFLAPGNAYLVLRHVSDIPVRENAGLTLAQKSMVTFYDQVRVKLIAVEMEAVAQPKDGAVVHPTVSSLVRRAQASAARGAVEVTEQLQRLRDQGKIDEHGNILVPWPDDMKPGSSTDL